MFAGPDDFCFGYGFVEFNMEVSKGEYLLFILYFI